jgi:hypothetical protein
LSFTSATIAADDVFRITIESSEIPNCYGQGGAVDGLNPCTAAVSGYQLSQDFPSYTSDLYWIQNENINEGVPIRVYVDMVRDGGGWTLILANGSLSGWNETNALNLNSGLPPANPSALSANYSIIGFADYIKKSASNFQYRIEAGEPGAWGGVWTANQNYSFVSRSNTNTNITLNTKFGNWNYNNSGIEARMPYYTPGAQGIITTSENTGSEWWGTLVARSDSGGWSPAPWIASSFESGYPGIIWYWVR